MLIEPIIQAIEAGRIRVTDHADEEAVEDNLHLDEILHATIRGEIIEAYPTDHPYPSCLVLGMTPNNDPIHSVWAYNAEVEWAVLITVYRPDPSRWINWRRRKKQ